MKKTILIFASLIFVAFTTKATIITVSNNPLSPGQYTSAQEAADAASAGDTLYFSGSVTSYGSVTITKQLTLIGTGYNPDNQFDLISSFIVIYLSHELDEFNNPISTASGSKFIGLDMTNFTFGLGNEVSLSNILIQRCRFDGEINFRAVNVHNGVVIENSILNNVDLRVSENIIIRNNVFSGSIYTSYKSSVVITNNIFHGSGSSAALTFVEYATVTNNIFYYSTPTECTFTTFNNNISYSGGANDFLYGSNTGSNNQEGVDPLFTGIVSASAFSFDNDYTLADGSPAIGAGTDGTDIGITGGARPMTVEDKKFSPIPQIIQMDVLNSTIPVDGTLNVRVNANVQN